MNTFIPESASRGANQINIVFLAWASLSALALFGIVAGFAYLVLRYRRDRETVRAAMRSGYLFVGAAVVAASVLTLGAVATGVYFNISPRRPQGADKIYVFGKRWMWRFEHLDGRIEINELHIPVGRPVKLVIVSQDTEHGFFAPALHINQRAMPGEAIEVPLEPVQTGNYEFRSSRYSGPGTTGMQGLVHVMDPARYAHWMDVNPAPKPIEATQTRSISGGVAR